mmetsp:Transcript_28874/g.61292  ORF Transcript_28874/g.61292 Transcript_28874/m.61292 type:complete len:578 (-) Transcript_28874:80-1813(-)|eukprot:CAMPEP_0171408644 /NCGR_PEP_ID=MMETSP0880-20121228/22494_1 /TAXON_ID=67004 /ORGANISM="Thalassiosira weissflogii, Strain CCMP1336" /LENGTH=577 /DNA_ID=CAMNT_0011924903 /DNA_START=264 /DNA_END=1997 /DNA_ORIENTATION=+
MSNSEEVIPIGIDLGSLHARVAIGNTSHHKLPAEGVVDTRPLPNIISNAQGSRYTLALVGIDKVEAFGDDNGAIERNGDDEARHVFGEAARRALARDKKPTISKDPSSMVRELVRSGSSFVSNGDEKENKADVKAAAFFAHLAELACDASSSHPSKLRTVVSVPVGSTPEEQAGVVQSVERGIENALAARKSPEDGKSKEKKKQKDEESEGIVVGVITDPAAVCIAHGLTEIEESGAIDLDSAGNTSSSWKNVLVIDWGASGLTATHIQRSIPNSNSLLRIVRHATEASCAGIVIVNALVAHCSSMFERKNRVTGLMDSVKAHHRLEMACETAVRTLTRAPTVTVAVDGLYEGMDMAVPVSRPRFDMLVSGLLRKAELLLQTFSAEEFDVVLVAGNVCEMPAALNLIRTKLFPNAHTGRGDVPPEEAVAIGCARHAASVLACPTHSKSIGDSLNGMEGVGPATRKVPLCPLSIGICKIPNDKTNGDLETFISNNAYTLIGIGDALPANVSKCFKFSNGTEGSSIAVVQIQGGAGQKSKVLGNVENIPLDADNFEITMELTTAGKLTVAVNGGPTCKL